MGAKPGKSTDILDAVALIVVDMQTSFLDVIEGAPAVIERCGFAIEAARALGLRVVFTEQVPEKLGATDPRLLGLVPGARVFAKSTFSALQADGLLEYLRRHGVYHLLLVGIEIPVCIYQTALHAVDSDLDVTVLSDCVTGRRAEDCLVTLEALTHAHCHLLPAETVYYSMLGNSAHPLFSGFNALVKRYAQPGGLDSAPPPPAPREHHHHERRPVLAAPEDRHHEPAPDEFPAGSSDTSTDSEPYIGRATDGAPVDESRETADLDDDKRDDAPLDESERDDTDSADDASDVEDDSAPRAEGGDSGPDHRGGQGGQGDQAGPGGGRRRGRRRRGGARRRRARERREGAPPDGASTRQGTPAGAPERQPSRGDDVGPSSVERAPE